MNIFLWILQAFLAALFLFHGWAFLERPVAMRPMIDALPFSRPMVVFLGIAEMLAAFGLILPLATGILPWLMPLAALSLVPIMLGALGYHLTRRELRQSLMLSVLTLLIAFVAYSRWNLFTV